MNIDLVCPSCGRSWVVDSRRVSAGGSSVHCPSCGTSIGVIVPADELVARPVPSVRKRRPPTPPPSGEVVCPRCGLHFAPSGRPVASAGSKATVLVVEDNPYFVESAREALHGEYEVRTASTIRDALKLMAAEEVDIVLLDLVLENGEDGLRLLSEMPAKPCPVVIFTAQDESEMYGEKWERLRSLGADDVIFKGMNMGDALRRKVSEILGEPAGPESLRD